MRFPSSRVLAGAHMDLGQNLLPLPLLVLARLALQALLDIPDSVAEVAFVSETLYKFDTEPFQILYGLPLCPTCGPGVLDQACQLLKKLEQGLAGKFEDGINSILLTLLLDGFQNPTYKRF